MINENKNIETPETPISIGKDQKQVLQALNLWFESPIPQKPTLVTPSPLPPDIPGRAKYIEKLNKMSIDELKKEMKKYGLKTGSKSMMKERLTMVWDSLHPNSPMIKKLDAYIRKNKERHNQQLASNINTNHDKDWKMDEDDRKHNDNHVEESDGSISISISNQGTVTPFKNLNVDSIFNILLS